MHNLQISTIKTLQLLPESASGVLEILPEVNSVFTWMFTLVRRTPVGIRGPRTNCAIGFQNCIDLEVLWKSTQKLLICQHSTSQCALLQLAGRRDILDHQSTALSPMATQSNHRVAMLETVDNPFLHICHCRGISNLVEGRVVISHDQGVLLLTPNLLLNLMRKWGQNWQKQRGSNVQWRSNWLWVVMSGNLHWTQVTAGSHSGLGQDRPTCWTYPGHHGYQP